jgi:O-antigen/teichoic acid export membrane protein
MKKNELLKSKVVSLGILFITRTLLTLISGLIVPLFLIKDIGLSAYGEFIFLSTLGMVLLVLSELGVNTVYIREALHLTPKQAKEYLWKAIVLRVVTFLPFAIISVLIAYLYASLHNDKELLHNLLWIVASTFFLTLQNQIYMTNLSLNRNYQQMISEFVSRVIWIVGALYAGRNYGVTGLLAVVTLASLLQVTLGGIGLVKFSREKTIPYRKIWRSSRNFGVNSILIGLLNKVDIILIGVFFGPTITGAYGYGSRIRDFFIELTGTVSSSYFKKLKTENKKAIYQIQKNLTYLAAVLGTLGAPFAIIVGWILKEELNKAEIVLALIAFSFMGIIMVINQNIMWLLTARNLVKELNQAILYNIVTKAILITIAGFMLGFKGLLLAIFANEILYLMSLTQVLREKHNYDYLISYLPLMVSVGIILLAYQVNILFMLLVTLIILVIFYSQKDKIIAK